jgi:hypothetical protein
MPPRTRVTCCIPRRLTVFDRFRRPENVGARKALKRRVFPQARVRRKRSHRRKTVARHFGAELVSPAVAWLCSEKCEETANIITASAGGFARMQFFETKGAKEFGIERNGTVLTAMLMDVPTVRAIGLDQGQGLYYSNTFYWDRTDGTRAFTRRLTALNNGTYPSQNVAGAYSAVLHYLKAVAALGVAKAKSDGRAVVARMNDGCP